MRSAAFTFVLVFWAGCATIPYTPPVETKGIVVDPGQDLNQWPELVMSPMPAYPMFALDAGIQGTVLLHALVDRDGRVEAVEVLEPVTALTESAKHGVMQWEFKPAMKDGQPVEAWVRVPITFNLDAARQQR